MSDTDAGAADVTPLSANGVVDIDSSGDSIADVMALYSKSDPIQVDDGESDGAENADDAKAVEEALSEKDNVESPEDEETATNEDEKDEPDVPAIDPPKSWSKEAHERWNKLDPETQKWLADRDSEDQKAIKRSFNEAAENRKAAEAVQAKAEQTVRDYEAKLPALMEAIHQASPFADIKTMADVEKMQAEDPFRFQQFQLYQWKMAGTAQELKQAEARQAQDKQQKAQTRAAQEQKLLIEKVPEFADEQKLTAAQTAARALFVDKGFTDTDLADIRDNPLLADHRFQLIVHDALKYAALQKAPPKAIPKPVPPVQKPGASQPNGTRAANIQNLERTFERTGSVEDAFALQQARDRRRAS